MSTYRFLQDCYVNGVYFNAGGAASTADVGGSLPTNWQPSGAVEPLDSAAITDFWNAGPQICGLIRTQFSTLPVAPPAIFWRRIPTPPPTTPPPYFPPGGVLAPAIYQLTGAGAALGPAPMSNRGALP
jgi:hypothetical protein